jgi:type I restriction enzyme S subunit
VPDINRLPTFLPGMDERHKIVTVLDALGMKIKTGQTKKKLLEELFHTLLYRLMTAQIRVHDLDLPQLVAAAAE